MEKNKVLFVVHHLTIGGAQKSLITALRFIDYGKYDVTVYIRKNRLDILPEVDKRVKVIVNDDKTHYYRKAYALMYLLKISFLKMIGKTGRAFEIEKKLSERIRLDMLEYEKKRFFENEHYDVAIAYKQGYTADIAADGIDADRKYIFYHSSTDEAHEFHERIFDKFDKIIAVGDNIKSILQNLYPNYSDKIEVMYNYVDSDFVIAKSGSKEPYTPSGKNILCTCGRLSPVKGFDLAVEAAKILKNNHIRFTWYFIGDGPERERLEKMIVENSLSECITITGMKDNPYPLIKACDIYIQPSYEEAYGLTIAEAQILCRPVVSTKTVGGKYLVKDGETGVITDISAEGLADGIMKLITDPELCQKISENLSKIDYDIEKERYKKQWENILGGQKA